MARPPIRPRRSAREPPFVVSLSGHWTPRSEERPFGPEWWTQGIALADILHVMQKIGVTRNTSASQGMDARSRENLERELLEDMTSWSPRDRGGAFTTWHRHSLSLVHLNVLTALEAEGPLAMKRLAEMMDVSDASATGIVDRMEKRSLVERRHSTEDSRKVL